MFDTEMDIYLPPGNCQIQSQRQTVVEESAFSSGRGPCFPVSRPPAGPPTPTSHLAPPDEPHCLARAPGGAEEYHPPIICRVHHEKRWAERSTSWNQDGKEKYQ